MKERCPRCDKVLEEVTECSQCTFQFDPNEPEQTEELDFNTESERTYSPDFSVVYDNAQELEDRANDS